MYAARTFVVQHAPVKFKTKALHEFHMSPNSLDRYSLQPYIPTDVQT